MKRAAWMNLGVIPALLTAFLSSLACPACWPSYAGLLSWLGLSVVASERYMPLLTAVSLAMALTVLVYGGSKRRAYGALALGTLGAALMIAGALVTRITALTVIGSSVLVISFVWNGLARSAERGCANQCWTEQGCCNPIAQNPSQTEAPQ